MLLTILNAGSKVAYDIEGGPRTSFFLSVAPAEMRHDHTLEIDTKNGLSPRLYFGSQLINSEDLARGLEKIAKMIREKYAPPTPLSHSPHPQ